MPDDAQTPYAAIGGETVLRQVVERFYHLLETKADYAAVRVLHGPDLAHARETLLEFLTGWLGGPAHYFQKPERPCMMSAHARLPIGAEEARQWLACMAQAMGDCGIEAQIRQRLQHAFGQVAARMQNR